jgi:acetylornithine/succinyldiaminopimelate/putrescine aminotransferase
MILLEPVQGEGGVNPATPKFLRAARLLADELGALLVFDEVQTGVGRTGTFFCFQPAGVRPDAVTLAKGLANGLPIGALIVSDDAPRGFEPGDHASTFGGNPVCCAAACAVIDAVDDALLENVRERGAQIARTLPVRGQGLLLGLDLGRPAAPVVEACLDAGLLTTAAGPETLRLTPPLVVTADEVNEALAILAGVL